MHVLNHLNSEANYFFNVIPKAAQATRHCSQQTIHLVIPDLKTELETRGTFQELPSPTGLHVAAALLQALDLSSEGHNFRIQALEVSVTHHVKLVLPEAKGKLYMGLM